VWHNKGPVRWTRVSGILCWPILEQAIVSRVAALFWGRIPESHPHPALPSGRVGLGCRSLLLWGKALCGIESNDGGRFSAQGTGRRAVKCFDPAQDHQRRKHWAGLDLPVKSECAVIEEDQIPL